MGVHYKSDFSGVWEFIIKSKCSGIWECIIIGNFQGYGSVL